MWVMKLFSISSILHLHFTLRSTLHVDLILKTHINDSHKTHINMRDGEIYWDAIKIPFSL